MLLLYWNPWNINFAPIRLRSVTIWKFSIILPFLCSAGLIIKLLDMLTFFEIFTLSFQILEYSIWMADFVFTHSSCTYEGFHPTFVAEIGQAVVDLKLEVKWELVLLQYHCQGNRLLDLTITKWTPYHYA